jgi:methylated-DNA-[protein]-cysteine S-methyltransferase
MQKQPQLVDAILAGQVLPQMTFSQKVWAATASIPPGKVATYGQIAQALNSTGSRAVGMALNRNPYAPQVPCHRVVGSDGRLVGFAGGLPAKEKLLESEGVPVSQDRVDLTRFRCDLTTITR